MAPWNRLHRSGRRWLLVAGLATLVGLGPAAAGADQSRLYLSPDSHWGSQFSSRHKGPYSRSFQRGYQQGYRQGFRDGSRRHIFGAPRLHRFPGFAFHRDRFDGQCFWVRDLRRDRFGHAVAVKRRVCR